MPPTTRTTATPGTATTPETATDSRSSAMPDLDRILRYAREIPALSSFPTVDDLITQADAIADNFPDVVERSRIGTSRLGEALWCYSLGAGPAAIVAGGVHPNEPIGFHTSLHLMQALTHDERWRAELGVRWHIIPCIDPDGARLNEGWFAAPQSRTAYARGFYRPAPQEQVEWSFPFDYKDAYFDQPIPETQAIMRLADRTRPALFVGLHNSELGGVYYYLNRDVPGAIETLHAIPADLGLPLDEGEPEAPHLTTLAEAVFRAPLSSEHYDYLETLGDDPAAQVGSGGSADYLSPLGTLTFVAELPYWTHPASEDTSASNESYADVLARKATGLQDLGAVLTDALSTVEPYLRLDTPFRRSAEAFAPHMSQAGDSEAIRAQHPDSQRPASVAEVFSNDDMVRCFRLRFGGIVRRALHAEVEAGTAHPVVRRTLESFSHTYEAWLAEADQLTDLESLPIERLVGVQFASTLAMATLAVTRT